MNLLYAQPERPIVGTLWLRAEQLEARGWKDGEIVEEAGMRMQVREIR